jgi:hypothetical protein
VVHQAVPAWGRLPAGRRVREHSAPRRVVRPAWDRLPAGSLVAVVHR